MIQGRKEKYVSLEATDLIETMSASIAFARDKGQMMYVFKQDGTWYYSGKLPLATTSFYLVYPNGRLDKSENAPEIPFSSPPEKMTYPQGRKQFMAQVEPSNKEKLGKILMTAAKKIFIGYCAFAPFFAFALSFLFSNMVRVNDLWGFSFMTAMFCVPFSFVFALVSLHRPKSARIAAVASALASDAHMFFYGHLWFMTVSAIDPGWMIGTTMVSIMMSGIALLLIWDNEA